MSAQSIRWWLTVIKRNYRRDDPADLGHFNTLLHMISGTDSANEAEQLDWCFRRVTTQDARSSSGLWCVCLREDAPSTAESRGTVGGDSKAALVAVKVDLEFAADELPISWSTTQRAFETQGRAGIWQRRFGEYRANRHVREIDRWAEPRDPDTGRPKSAQLANYLMALALHGARTECPWPGVLTPNFGAAVFEHHRQRAQEAA